MSLVWTYLVLCISPLASPYCSPSQGVQPGRASACPVPHWSCTTESACTISDTGFYSMSDTLDSKLFKSFLSSELILLSWPITVLSFQLFCFLWKAIYIYLTSIAASEQFTEVQVWILHWVTFRQLASFGPCLSRISLMKHHLYRICVSISYVPHFYLVVVFPLR